MPIDLCQTKRSSFVGESLQLSAAKPSTASTSAAIVQCSHWPALPTLQCVPDHH